MRTPYFEYSRNPRGCKPPLVSICQTLAVLVGLLLTGAFPAPVRADDYSRVAGELSKAAVRHGKRRVAVLPFQEGGGRGGSGGLFVSEKITGPLLNDERLEVVERTLLQSVLKEQRLQLSGAADPRSIKELGKVLGVEAIVTGTLLNLKDDRVELNARLIDAETARVLWVASARVQKEWAETLVGDVFDIQVPPLGGFETNDMRDSVAGDETNCLSARSRAADIDRSLIDLKARYWAARLRSPGFSRSALKTNPGSEIEDADLKADFYAKLKRYYQESAAPVSDAEIEQLNAGQNKIRQINDLCRPAGA
ncbi:MAG: hypothetical protein HY077_09145 [Elusimicrobia bacterium]|nr:hypothetical protein [Elusimicrobiota bacterium]